LALLGISGASVSLSVLTYILSSVSPSTEYVDHTSGLLKAPQTPSIFDLLHIQEYLRVLLGPTKLPVHPAYSKLLYPPSGTKLTS